MPQTTELDLSGSTVPDLIGCATLRFPNKVAVATSDRTLTFAEVSERASRLAAALRARGITDGRRVGLLAMNDIEYLEIRVGAQRAGAILVPLNYRLAELELVSILDDADVDVLIVGRGLEAVGSRMRVPSVMWLDGPEPDGPESYRWTLDTSDPLPVPAGYPPEDIAQICYTSGTTARPKGVMLSNRSVHAGTMAMGHELGPTPNTVFLVCTPLFHIGAQVAFSCTYLGATLVQMQKFDVEGFLEALDRSGATHCQMVPTMIQMVLDQWGDRGDSSLERILYGAAPMSPALLRRAIDTWGCEFVNGYGSTESTGASFLTPGEHDPEAAPHLLASVGCSSHLSTCRVVEDDRDLPPGQIGEVVVKGPALMSGYWRNPEATAEALRTGWMHTGDLAYRDEHGYLYLVDRRHDKIVTGGENVFPSEVEHVIEAHPDVREVAVIGVPDPVWGEAVAAVVVLDQAAQATPVSEGDIIAHCRQSLAGYKVPKQVRFATDELPRTPTGKLLRRELRRTWPSMGGDGVSAGAGTSVPEH